MQESSKHLVRTRRPAPSLEAHIRGFAQRELELGSITVSEPVTARLEPVVEFQLGDAYRVALDTPAEFSTPPIAIVGPQTRRRADILLSGRVESFGIFFRPSGLWRQLGIRVSELTNDAREADEVFGSGIVELWHRLAEAGSFEARVGLAEEYLLRASRGAPSNPIAAAADRMLATRGANTIPELAEACGLGVRQFERRFRQDFGMTPKLCNRVARFQSALDLRIARPMVPWLQVAHWAGYHDQMHLIKEFQALGGMSPTQILREIRDQRPTAWIGSDSKRSGDATCRVFTRSSD